MKTPLIDAIKKHAKDRKFRFCMPGHKGVKRGMRLFSSAFFDITELDYSDNLLFSDSVILESEMLTATAVKAERTLYLTSGSTTGNLISALAVKERGSDVLVERASHNSVYNAIGLAGLNPHFIENRIVDGIPHPLTLEDVKSAYFEGATALFLTSPNYFGRVAQMKEICEFAHEKNMLVVCDSAHGAHFAYSSLLPEASHVFADITVASAHKTLPVYTGGAYLHVKGALFEDVERIRRVVHTTSPSYLVMSSMDYAQGVLSQCGERAYKRLHTAVNNLKAISNIKVEDVDDFTRICLISRDGNELCERLKGHGIESEFSFGSRCVLIASPFDIKSVKKLTKVLSKMEPSEPVAGEVAYPKQEVVVPYLDAFNGQGEYVPVHEAEGRISAGLIGLYPPAVPLCAYGEKITEEIIALADKFPSSVYGLANGMAFVLK